MPRASENSLVAVLGASTKEERFSFKAVKMLKEHGHRPIPVHPAGHVVDGITALKSLDEIDADNNPVDTLTLYINPKISSGELDSIIKLKPRRVIFNPETENEELAENLAEAGIEIVRQCTLVMLQADEF